MSDCTISPMETLANWNGQVLPLTDVTVPALDRAFMFGESIYEVIRVYGGRLWNLQEHLDRLDAGLKELSIQFDTRTVEPKLQDLLAQTRLKEALAYIQVTRGAAERHHHYPTGSQPNCLIYLQQFDDPYAEARKNGAKATLFDDIRWARNDIKATSLVANCMAAEAAKSSGCIEALLVKNATISEGSHTSVFGAAGGKIIVSPSSAAVLPGITKKQVIELCKRAGIEMVEGRLTVAELSRIDELFITATPEEIIAIVQVDKTTIGSGSPGPLTQRLQAIFRQTVEQWLSSTEP